MLQCAYVVKANSKQGIYKSAVTLSKDTGSPKQMFYRNMMYLLSISSSLSPDAPTLRTMLWITEGTANQISLK